MTKQQTDYIFEKHGKGDIFERYQYRLDVHGFFEKIDTSDTMDEFLSCFDIELSDDLSFDCFLYYYHIYQCARSDELIQALGFNYPDR